MAYLYIENFEAGLDTRKSRFTAPAGSLRTFKNAHITRGKEIERRKAFDEIASLPAGAFGLHAVGAQLYAFTEDSTVASAFPFNVEAQTLQNGNDPATAMSRMWAAENFAGKIYAIAEYVDGRVYHFYDGVIVSDWDTLSADLADKFTVSAALVLRAQEDAVLTAVQYGEKFRLTGDPGVAFMVQIDSGSLLNTRVQSAVTAQAEVRATASFDITGGSTAPGVNTISVITADGTDLIGSSVDYDTDNATTAAAVATRINAGVTSYDASSSGGTVTITAPAGLGASANGRVLDVQTTGNVTVANVSNFSGGSDPVEAESQVEEITVTADPVNALEIYSFTIDGNRSYKIRGHSSAIPTSIKAFKQKMYAPTGSLVYFSGFRGTYESAGVRNPALPDPTMWINYDDDPNDYGIGAGAINLAEQLSGSEVAIGLGIYQNRLAIFAKRSVQIWNVDPDPDLNSIYQVLLNVGAVSANSIMEYGDQDIFFLSETGLRSLRARDSSNIASTSDVGVAIDQDLNDYVRSQTQEVVARSHAVLEPLDGRYLLSLGGRIYVFSNFPGSNVSAWSTYELSAGDVSDWAETGSNLFCRVKDFVLQYGGASGQVYDTDETEVELPFLDAGQPAQYKQLTGLDFGGAGLWKTEMALEPTLPEERDTVAVFNGNTYGSLQKAGAVGKSTHISLRLTTSEAERSVIGNLIIHYEPIEAR